MSYTLIKTGLHERLATVTTLQANLKYEPSTIQVGRAIYSILQGFDREYAGQLVIMRYRTLHRLLVRWQDNAGAEAEFDALINEICAAVDLDPQLGGRVNSGISGMTVGNAEWRDISGVLYRSCDIISETVEKGPYQGAGI